MAPSHCLSNGSSRISTFMLLSGVKSMLWMKHFKVSYVLQHTCKPGINIAPCDPGEILRAKDKQIVRQITL